MLKHQNIYTLFTVCVLLNITTISHHAYADISNASNARLAASASIEYCLKPLLNGVDGKKYASQRGLTQLPEKLFQLFKRGKYNNAGYYVRHGEIILLTSTTPVCAIAIRTLNADKFEKQLKAHYSKATHFTLTRADTEKNAVEIESRILEFQSVQKNRTAIVIASFDKEETRDAMQGLITIAITDNPTTKTKPVTNHNPSTDSKQ